MADLTKLQKYLSVEIVQNGDTIRFVDAGKIENKEFEDKDTKEKKRKDVFEIGVMYKGQIKIYSPNKTSLKLLQVAYGTDSDNWVGCMGKIALVEQLAFGELKTILVVKPFGPANINNATSGLKTSAETQPQGAEQSKTGNPGGVKTPDQIEFEQ